MKGCLKSPLPSPCIARKCVAFCEEGSEEVHLADEWDRTPMEPARKLSFFDFLELKEIQRSLPKADQTRDPTWKSAPEYLSKVPVGLLPLLPDSATVGSAVSSPQSTTSTCTLSGPPASKPLSSPPLPNKPPMRTYLTHLTDASPGPQRPKPKFTFLPLLDTSPHPPSAPCSSSPIDGHDDESPDLSTPSLSLDSSSRDSSASPSLHPRSESPSPPLAQPDPSGYSYFPPFSDTHTNDSDHIPPPQQLSQDSLKLQNRIPSPLSLDAATAAIEAGTTAPTQPCTEMHDSTQADVPQDSSWAQVTPDNLANEQDKPAHLPLPSLDAPPLPILTLTVSEPMSPQGQKPPSEPRRASLFPFERERDQTRPSSPKSSSDLRCPSARICGRDLRPPSPIVGPYRGARRRRTSPCPSPVSSPWCG